MTRRVRSHPSERPLRAVSGLPPRPCRHVITYPDHSTGGCPQCVADVGSAKWELRSPWQGLGQQSAIADARAVLQNLNGRDFRACDRALVVFCALINPRFYDIYLCLSGRRAFTMRRAYRGVDSAFDKHNQRAGKLSSGLITGPYLVPFISDS